jgi:hypothetical protein
VSNKKKFATNCRASLYTIDLSSKPQAASSKPASSKQQAASIKLQAAAICHLCIENGYDNLSRAARELVSTIRYKPCEACIRGEAAAAHINKGEKYERQDSEIRIPSGRSEARRGQEECRQVLTGTDPGDAAGTPRVPNYGPKIHRDRISGNSKSSRQRSSSRLCLELTQRALSGATPLTTNLPGLPSLRSEFYHQGNLVPGSKPASSKLQDSSSKTTSSSGSSYKLFKASSTKLLKVQATSFKPQAASSKLQAASAELQNLVAGI